MADIPSRAKRYRIDRPGILAAGESAVDLEALATQIDRMAAIGTESEDGEAQPAAELVEKLSNKQDGMHTLVVDMTEEAVQELKDRHGEGIRILEDDIGLELFAAPASMQERIAAFATLNVVPLGDQALTFAIKVVDPEGAPLPLARVSLYGEMWDDEGVTDDDGLVSLTLFGETPDTLRTLAVKPARDHWGLRIERPALTPNSTTDVTVQPLYDGTAFPDQQVIGWAKTAMKLDRPLPSPGPVKLAIIDSGVDGAHPDLATSGGRDFGDTSRPNQSWKEDASGHGTHVAGICAATDNAIGVLGGAAKGAKVYGLRVFPGARVSKLLAALDWCIDQKVDVANMSLGTTVDDPGFHDRIQAARRAGVLLVAAAGNSAGPVAFPAAYPEVMAVAAIGKRGTFPDNSPHQGHVPSGSSAEAGDYFAAGFTCFGPEIDLCANGVAVVSTVPGGGYLPMDGTSMASPQIAGFAARLLQADKTLRNLPRDEARVQALWDAILATCTDLGLPATLQGRGMPVFPAEGAVVTTRPNPSEDTTARLKDLLGTLNEAIEAIDGELARA
ncbi:MAG: S8 family serine peptidase [Pseudomonadota bacterium]